MREDARAGHDRSRRAFHDEYDDGVRVLFCVSGGALVISAALSCSSFSGNSEESNPPPDSAPDSGEATGDAPDASAEATLPMGNAVVSTGFDNGCDSQWELHGGAGQELTSQGRGDGGAACQLCLIGNGNVTLQLSLTPTPGSYRIRAWVRGSKLGSAQRKGDVGFQFGFADGGSGSRSDTALTTSDWVEFERTAQVEQGAEFFRATLSTFGTAGDCVDFDDVVVERL